MKMVVVWLLVMFFVRTLSHTITSLEVPRWPDPRKEAELRCLYTRQPGDPLLHSVKWYRDAHEIFRYTPQEYESRTFNESVTNSSCDLMACLIRLRPERGTAKYTCEVSSEGPRFAVDRKSANMTLAVLPEYDPLITGLPTLVQAGEQALVNCTSDYSLPAATIDWFVDSEPQEDPLITHPTHISGADSDGLRASWRTLRVFPDDYETHRGYLALRCRATVPTRPPSVRAMSVRLYVAARPHISTYMFSKNIESPKNSVVIQWSAVSSLRVFPDDYESHRGYLALRCRATVPTRPPSVRAMSVRLYVAARPHISTYMFSKNKAAAGCARHHLRSEMILWTLLLLARRRVPFLGDQDIIL